MGILGGGGSANFDRLLGECLIQSPSLPGRLFAILCCCVWDADETFRPGIVPKLKKLPSTLDLERFLIWCSYPLAWNWYTNLLAGSKTLYHRQAEDRYPVPFLFCAKSNNNFFKVGHFYKSADVSLAFKNRKFLEISTWASKLKVKKKI